MHAHLSTFLFQVVNFLVLVLVLRRWLYRPVLAMIARRQQEVLAAAAAAADRRTAAELRAQADQLLAEARGARAQALQQAAQESQSRRDELLADARRAAEDLAGTMRADLQRERAGAEVELRARAAEVAVAIAARLLDAAGGLAPTDRLLGNLSVYIPTNLISITDGQIVLDAKLFQAGQKPAVDVGLSVSRVGGKTQRPEMRKLAEPLRLAYAQFLELEVFTHFGGITDERTRKVVEHGRRIRAVLAQRQLQPQPFELQVAVLQALADGTLDQLPVEQIEGFRRDLAGKLGGPPPRARHV